MRTEIVKLPEESAGEALQRTDIGNDSWNKVPKNTGERPEINKQDYIKSGNLGTEN